MAEWAQATVSINETGEKVCRKASGNTCTWLKEIHEEMALVPLRLWKQPPSCYQQNRRTERSQSLTVLLHAHGHWPVALWTLGLRSVCYSCIGRFELEFLLLLAESTLPGVLSGPGLRRGKLVPGPSPHIIMHTSSCPTPKARRF